MSCKVSDIITIMEEIAPPDLAEDWDNVGLQIGSKRWPITKIWIALDATPPIISKAVQNGVNLLITHHPLFFKPFRTLDLDTIQGRCIDACISHKLCVYSAHTNLDSVNGGLNDILADCIGLENRRVFDQPKQAKWCKVVIHLPPTSESRILNNINKLSVNRISRYPGLCVNPSQPQNALANNKVIENNTYLDKRSQLEEVRLEFVIMEKDLAETLDWLKQYCSETNISYEIYPFLDPNSSHGIGRVGELPSPLKLKQFAQHLRKNLSIDSVRMVGDPALSVSQIAICTGSGGGLLHKFIHSHANVYVTGDIKYHDALMVKEAQKAMIDIGHFASEKVMIDAVARRIQQSLQVSKIDSVVVESCHLASDPFQLLS